MTTKEKVLADLNQERNRLYQLLRSLPEDQIMKPEAIGGRSVADICGHLSAWEDRLLTILQQITQEGGGKPKHGVIAGLGGEFCRDDLFDNERFNQVARGRRRGWRWREYLNELVLTREESGWTLAHLSEEAFLARHAIESERGSLHLSAADLVIQIAHHDRLHRTEIESWWNRNGHPPKGSKAQ